MAAEKLSAAQAEGAGVVGVHFSSHAREWIAAWNAHDLERILALYADDAELVSPFVSRLTGRSDGSLRGKAALRDDFARGLKASPMSRFEFIRLYPGVRSCVLEYRSVNGLRAAETMKFDSQGKVRRVLAHYTEDSSGEPVPSHGRERITPLDGSG